MILRRRKTLRGKQEPTVDRANSTVWVQCSLSNGHKYLHFVMPGKHPQWMLDSLVTFESELPRINLLNNLKAFFEKTSSPRALSFSDLEEVVYVENKEFEAYLNRVERLPNHLQAVTTILRLHLGNSEQTNFEKNLEAAKQHHAQWENVTLEDQESSEMYLEPLAGQWGLETWRDINALSYHFSLNPSSTQKAVLRDCEDPEYRRYINVLANTPEELFNRAEPYLEELQTVLKNPRRRRVSYPPGATWILEIPLGSKEFREEILNLTLPELGRLSIYGRYCPDATLPVWIFNAKAFRASREGETKEEFHARIVTTLRQKISESNITENVPDEWFRDLVLEVPWKTAFYRLFADYLEALPADENFVQEYGNLWRVFHLPETWTSGSNFSRTYIISELQRVTGSAEAALEILKEASHEVLELSSEDWFNFISNYDMVRGMDITIAITLLQSDED